VYSFLLKSTKHITKILYYVSMAAVGVGIWDTKFGVYHSWTPLSDSKQLHGQVCCDLFTVIVNLMLSLFLHKSSDFSSTVCHVVVDCVVGAIFQLYYAGGRLLLACMNGIYMFPVVPKVATLGACLGKTSTQASVCYFKR